MQNQDSNLRLKTSAIEDIFYLCAALAFDGFRTIVNHYPRHYSCCFPFCIHGDSWKLHWSAVIYVWESKRVQLIPLLFNWPTIHNQWWCMAYHRKPCSNIIGYERYMAGKSIKTVTHVWNSKDVKLTPLQFNWLANHTPFTNNHNLSQII